MRNKLIGFLALTVCIFLLFSCSEKTEELSIVGTWKYELNEGKREAITEVIQDPAVYVDIYYIFNEDGTGSTYASDGSYNRSFDYTYKEGVLTISSDGTSFDQSCILTDTTLTVHDDSSNDDVVFYKQ